jgi:hypothetical protein
MKPLGHGAIRSRHRGDLIEHGLSPAALSFFQRSSAFSSRARSFIAARSSAENPLYAVPVVRLADVFLLFVAAFRPAIGKHLLVSDVRPYAS